MSSYKYNLFVVLCTVMHQHITATLTSFCGETHNSGSRNERLGGSDREEGWTQTVDGEAWSQSYCLPDRLSVCLQHVKHLTPAGAVLITWQDDSTLWTTTEAYIEKLSAYPCLCIVYFFAGLHIWMLVYKKGNGGRDSRVTPAPLHLPSLLLIYLSVLVSSLSAVRINVIQQKIEAES